MAGWAKDGVGSAGPRVLVVSPLYHTDRGGLGRQAVLLTERLAELGARPLVATRRMLGLPERAWSEKVDVRALHAGRAWTHNYEKPDVANLITSLRFTAALASLMVRERGRYDLVHVHGASLPLLGAIGVARLLGKRVIGKVAAVHQGVEAGDLRRRYGPVGKLLARAFGLADGYVATTAEIEACLLGEGYARAQVARITNFIDTTLFRVPTAAERLEVRRALGVTRRTVVLCSGRLVARKNCDLLLDAFARAAPRAGEFDPLLIFLGDGPLKEPLEAQARRLGLLPHWVRFDGFQVDVWRWLAAADLLVLPSRIEGLPNAVLEGMACGLPVLATDLGGCREALVEGESGVLVPPDDVAALERELLALLRDPRRRMNLGAAAARRIQEKFTLEAIAPRYLGLYARLLRGGPARGP